MGLCTALSEIRESALVCPEARGALQIQREAARGVFRDDLDDLLELLHCIHRRSEAPPSIGE